MSDNVLINVRWLGSCDSCVNVELARMLNISWHIRKTLKTRYCTILYCSFSALLIAD